MSYGKSPRVPRGRPVAAAARLARRVVGRVRRHVREWPGRFVEMQAEAFGD